MLKIPYYSKQADEIRQNRHIENLYKQIKIENVRLRPYRISVFENDYSVKYFGTYMAIAKHYNLPYHIIIRIIMNHKIPNELKHKTKIMEINDSQLMPPKKKRI